MKKKGDAWRHHLSQRCVFKSASIIALSAMTILDKGAKQDASDWKDNFMLMRSK